MFLSYDVYLCIPLNRTTFWNLLHDITQNTTPEENIWFHISSLIVLFFLWEGQRDFLGDKNQISPGEGKRME